jgi:hypothetical protein
MVGVPGAARTNSHPPSLLVLALAAIQCGLAILLHDRIGALLRRPRLWAVAVLVNLGALTILCWHQVAGVLVSGVTLALAPHGLPGLHDVAGGPVWILLRVAWLPVYLAVLAGCVTVFRRFER